MSKCEIDELKFSAFNYSEFNYYLDESDPDILVLKRQDGSFVAAFSAQGATKEGIREAVMKDYRALVKAHRDSLAPATGAR